MQAGTAIQRTTWNNYETGTSIPNLETLCTIAKYFGVTESDLLHEDLTVIGNLTEIEKRGHLGNPKGNRKRNLSENLAPLPVLNEPSIPAYGPPKVITVDTQGNENIVMVPVKARAGYLNGYSDPKFIKKLPAYRLPGMNNGTFRIFEVEGHSMVRTFYPGDLVIASYVEQLRDVRDDRVYVVVTKTDGVVIKRVLNRVEKDGKLILKSDNYKDRDMYPPIICDPEDILEIWYGVGYLSRQMRPPEEMYKRLIDLEGRMTLVEEENRNKLK